MSRLEANISLLIITFLGSVQYVFLAAVPESVSHFAFLCITNLVGFVISLAFFFNELFRLDSKQIVQSMILAAELVVFNVFMLLGASGISTTITAAVLSSYFVFVVAFSALFLKQRPNIYTVAGVLIVLSGLFLMTEADSGGFVNKNVLYLLVADAAFAVYVITIGAYASSSNPSILAMGQMLFCFLFSLVLWTGEAIFFGVEFSLPVDREFWAAVLYVSFSIRGLYTIVQIYAQRYVSPLNTSLIFSTEIIMTMAVSPLMARLFGTPPEHINALRIAGSVLIVFGLLVTEPGFFVNTWKFLHRALHMERGFLPRIKRYFSAGLNAKIVMLSAAAYALIDLPVQITDIFPIHAGIKNFIPFTVGLFYGPGGAIGSALGCALSFFVLGLPADEMLKECACVFFVGLGMWSGWHYFSRSHRIYFRRIKHYVVYNLLVLVMSAFTFDVKVYCSYVACGILIALPLNILFGNLLDVEPILPGGITVRYDADFTISADPETLNAANDILEETGRKYHAAMKQVFEIQSGIEELSIRILNALPETGIKIRVKFGHAVSVRMNYEGEQYNPFILKKGEDMLDIVGLNIIKHRALRASYAYKGSENFVHVVI